MYPLWSETNTSLYSSVFTVPTGKAAILFATGLLPEKVKVCAGEFKTKQTVCVRRLLFDFEPTEFSAYMVEGLPCGAIFDIDKVKAVNIVDDIVRTCGLPWQMTMCRNIALIGVPGTYRLQFNDATAIGEAQVYMELVDANAIPSQIENLFFA